MGEMFAHGAKGAARGLEAGCSRPGGMLVFVFTSGLVSPQESRA
jgi:hypothetical protein